MIDTLQETELVEAELNPATKEARLVLNVLDRETTNWADDIEETTDNSEEIVPPGDYGEKLIDKGQWKLQIKRARVPIEDASAPPNSVSPPASRTRSRSRTREMTMMWKQTLALK